MPMRKSRRARYRQEGPPPLEKSVERAIIGAAEALGFYVTKLSQPRATKQTPGIPDLYLQHRMHRWHGWCEVKRPGGKTTPAQDVWHDCERKSGGIVIVAESVDSFVEGLEEAGFPVSKGGA